MKTILVTGVNGFIGNAIAKALSEDFTVLGCDISDRANLNCTEYFLIDITKEESFTQLNGHRIDAIVHCAAKINYDDFDADLININCLGIRNLAHFANESKCDQVIYFSSLPIIGKPDCLPISEHNSINPLTTYHLTKYFGELFLELTYKEKLVNLRLTAPISCDMPLNRFLPIMVQKCLINENIELLGEGKRVQNYIDVDDIAEALKLIITNKIEGTFNLGSSQSYSNLEIAQMCIDLLQSNSRISFKGVDKEEDNKWIVSIEKSKQMFNFVPSKSIDQTILEIARRLREDIDNK